MANVFIIAFTHKIPLGSLLYDANVAWTLRVTLEKKSLSKFDFSEGVPSASKWSTHISRKALLSVNRLPFTKNVLIWDDDHWDLRSFQNNFSFDSTEIHSFFIQSSSVWSGKLRSFCRYPSRVVR